MKLAAIPILLFTASPALAGTPVYGFGATTCGTYIDQVAVRGAEARTLYFSWTQGFLTASNALLSLEMGAVPDLPGKLSNDEQQRELDQICRTDRSMEYSRASMKLLDKIRAAYGLPPILKN